MKPSKNKSSLNIPKKRKKPVEPACVTEKKAEARDRYAMAGVQFSGESIKDGLIYSIYDANSAVNKKYLEQANTKQFGRCFWNSKVVNADDPPKADPRFDPLSIFCMRLLRCLRFCLWV